MCGDGTLLPGSRAGSTVRGWAGGYAGLRDGGEGALQGLSRVCRTQCVQGLFRPPSAVRPCERSQVMARMGRSGTRSMLLATAVSMGLSLTLAVVVWSSTGDAARSQAGPPRPSSTGIGAAVVPTGTGGVPRGGPTSPGGADQLRRMDPASVDRYAAGEDATARGGPSQSAPAKGTWLVGEVGTYLVGRGVSPGRYESAGPRAGHVCRWGVTGTNGDTLRSGSGGTRTVVTIHKTDGFFQTQDCSNWRKIS